jgi:uncharacterized membrane protein YebE (DUF533 family)
VLKQFLFAVLSLVIVMGPMTEKSFAQQQGGDVEAFVEDTKTDLLIVISGGLAGAILGLSTLSFVEEPKRHTRNIIVGASLGIIAGVAYVAFNQANKSQEMFYGGEEANLESSKNFDTFARNDWHHDEFLHQDSTIVTPLSVGYTLTY